MWWRGRTTCVFKAPRSRSRTYVGHRTGEAGAGAGLGRGWRGDEDVQAHERRTNEASRTHSLTVSDELVRGERVYRAVSRLALCSLLSDPCRRFAVNVKVLCTCTQISCDVSECCGYADDPRRSAKSVHMRADIARSPNQ